MQVFEIAARHVAWLSQRQAVLAQNIANADTPGYRTKDVADFETVMSRATFGMAATSPGHMRQAPAQDAETVLRGGAIWDRSLSGNDVAIEAELMKADETSRMMALDTGIQRIFHRMLLSSLKA